MTDVMETIESTETKEVTPVVEEVTPVVKKTVPAKKTPEELKEANKKLQGERKSSKKKINKMNKQECLDEIQRLEKAGHQMSSYYKLIVKTAKTL